MYINLTHPQIGDSEIKLSCGGLSMPSVLCQAYAKLMPSLSLCSYVPYVILWQLLRSTLSDSKSGLIQPRTMIRYIKEEKNNLKTCVLAGYSITD